MSSNHLVSVWQLLYCLSKMVISYSWHQGKAVSQDIKHLKPVISSIPIRSQKVGEWAHTWVLRGKIAKFNYYMTFLWKHSIGKGKTFLMSMCTTSVNTLHTRPLPSAGRPLCMRTAHPKGKIKVRETETLEPC